MHRACRRTISECPRHLDRHRSDHCQRRGRSLQPVLATHGQLRMPAPTPQPIFPLVCVSSSSSFDLNSDRRGFRRTEPTTRQTRPRRVGFDGGVGKLRESLGVGRDANFVRALDRLFYDLTLMRCPVAESVNGVIGGVCCGRLPLWPERSNSQAPPTTAPGRKFAPRNAGTIRDHLWFSLGRSGVLLLRTK